MIKDDLATCQLIVSDAVVVVKVTLSVQQTLFRFVDVLNDKLAAG